jgi:hypothetical protein
MELKSLQGKQYGTTDVRCSRQHKISTRPGMEVSGVIRGQCKQASDWLINVGVSR